MPSVQITDLLSELAHVEPDAAGQSGPVDVPLFDPDLFLLERQKDLGLRIGIEIGLEGDLELTRHRVVTLGSLIARVEPDVTGRTDFGVQQVLAPGSGRRGGGRRRRSGAGRVRRACRRTPAGCGGGSPDGGELVLAGVRCLRGGRAGPGHAAGGDCPLDAVSQLLHRRSQGIEGGGPPGPSRGKHDRRPRRTSPGVERVQSRREAGHRGVQRIHGRPRRLLRLDHERIQNECGQPHGRAECARHVGLPSRCPARRGDRAG